MCFWIDLDKLRSNLIASPPGEAPKFQLEYAF